MIEYVFFDSDRGWVELAQVTPLLFHDFNFLLTFFLKIGLDQGQFGTLFLVKDSLKFLGINKFLFELWRVRSVVADSINIQVFASQLHDPEFIAQLLNGATL